MSKINLTNNQKLVVQKRDSNLLVSASAGSGKTFTMILRIIDILKKQEATIKELLVVTFTKSAASEMKNKIAVELNKNAKDNEFLAQQIDDLAVSNISTIHSFCANLIREHFYTLGIDPAFKTIEDAESMVLINKTLDKVINNYIKLDDKAFNKLYETYNINRNENKLRDTIKQIYFFLKSKRRYKDWAKESIENLYNENLNKNKAALFLNQEFVNDINYYKTLFNSLLVKASQIKSDRLISKITEVLNVINPVKEANNFEGNFKAVVNVENPALRGFTKLSEEEKKVYDILKAEKEDLFKLINKYVADLGQSVNGIVKNLNLSKQLLTKLIEVVLNFDEVYGKEKLSKGLLDFNDLEHYTYEILNNDVIASSVKEKFKYIFIDEYQDTNDLQEHIIAKLDTGKNLFMVGDVKQSIYGFRQCDPKIFINKYDKFTKNIDGTKIDLNKNYRSEKAILDFSNFIFNKIMTYNTSSVDYKNTSSFVHNESYNKAKTTAPLVSVGLIDYKKPKKEEVEPKVYSVKQHQYEDESLGKEALQARLAVKQIKQFVLEGHQIFDEDAGAYRQVEYGDIAILLSRRGKYINALIEELNNEKISANAKYKHNIFENYEVQLLVNYLKLINNVNDDFALTSVLTSTMYKLDFNDLIDIKNSCNSKEFYNCLLSSNNKQVNKLLTDLNEFRHKATYLSVKELILEVIEKYNLNTYFAALPKGAERINNVNLLLSVANRKEFDCVYRFVNYTENFADSELFSTQTDNDSNSVTITTIHDSKGLEYPVVILMGAGDEFLRKNTQSEVVIFKDMGFGVKAYDQTERTRKDSLARVAVKKAITINEKAEQMRLMYVALTRARNHLLVIGATDTSKLKSINSDYLVKKANNYLDWIMGSLSEDKLNLLKQNKLLSLNLSKDIDCKINIFGMEEFDNEKEKPKPNVLSLRDEDYIKQFKEIFDYKYKYTDSINVLSKSSVTEVMQKEDEDNVFNIKTLKVNELNSNKETDFLLEGNVYHKAMEMLNFNLNSEAEIEAEVKKLINENVLPVEATEILNYTKLKNALNYIGKLTNGAQEVLKEQQFMMYVPYNEVFKESKVTDKILIQGVIDLIVIKDNQVTLLDYKTSRIKDEAKMLKKYDTQLRLYKLAANYALGKEINKCIIYSFYLDNALINWQNST